MNGHPVLPHISEVHPQVQINLPQEENSHPEGHDHQVHPQAQTIWLQQEGNSHSESTRDSVHVWLEQHDGGLTTSLANCIKKLLPGE